MDLVKVRKVEDTLAVALPAELIAALHLAEDDLMAVQRIGDEIVLRRAAPETGQHTPPESRYPSAAELLKLPLDERDRILAAAAVEAEAEYRTNRALTDFEAFGESDLYDDYPDQGRGMVGTI